jgi:tetratricopeptide (TPR) repeat protein
VLSEGTLGVLGRAEKEMESGPPVPAEDKWLAMANLCESAQEWDRAAEYYLKLAEIVKEPAARQKYTLRAGGALQSAGKPADAAAACSKVMAAAATSENLAEAYRCAGMASESMKEWGEALTIYETYLEKVSAPGERAWALMRSAWCEERVGNAEGAMNLYREIVETVPRSYMAPEALIGLGILHESGKEYREARAAYGRILEEHAGSHKEAEAKRRIEEVAVKEKEWEKVREKLSGLSEQYPKRERGEGL